MQQNTGTSWGRVASDTFLIFLEHKGKLSEAGSQPSLLVYQIADVIAIQVVMVGCERTVEMIKLLVNI